MDLKGKIIDFLGDSITEGVGVADRERNRFDNILLRECGLGAVHNYGIGGSRLAHQSKPSAKPRHDLCFCGRAYDLDPSADIIIVYGGVNDYFHGDAPIGKEGDNTPATFTGAVEWLMSFLEATYPRAQLIFMTPARFAREVENYRIASLHDNKLPDKQPLVFYRDTILRAAARHGIPTLDLYTELPIEPLNPDEREKYTSDGLHFNDEGHKILARVVREFLERL